MSAIRVNPNPMPDLLTALEQLQQRQNTETLQLSTGSRINQPSDDPAGAAQLIQLANESQQNDSYQRSISSINGLFSSADSTLNSVQAALQRALSLGTEGANGTLSDSDRAAIAAELSGIQAQILSLANTTYQGQYIFSGTAETQPFVADSSSPSGVRYTGNTGINDVSIGTGYSVSVNVPGSRIFNGNGSDVFQSLSDLVTALNTNSGIDNAVSEVDNAFQYVTTQRVFYGNAMNQTEAQQNVLSSEKVELTQQKNDASSTDIAATATQLSQIELSASATLSAMAKLQQVGTLFDYLK